MREKTFNIRFSDEEWERLDRLSSQHGINAASLIRMLLKQADSIDTSRAHSEPARSAKKTPDARAKHDASEVRDAKGKRAKK